MRGKPIMATPRKKPEDFKKNGRPSGFKVEYCEQAYKLCLLGAKDKELANFFEVDVSTISKWKLDYPKFSEALKDGKDNADAEIAKSLFHRAKGYTHEAVKIFADPKTGAEQIVPYIEHYPPDTTACIFWLKNRQKEYWRDQQDLKHSGDKNNPVQVEQKIDVSKLTDDELNSWLAARKTR